MSARVAVAPPRVRPPRRFGLSVDPRIYTGNRVQLLVNGADYFPALLAAIEAAERSVYLETYIFADDDIGQRVIEALTAASNRGVDVRLVIDGFGGGEHARQMVSRLAASGAHVKIFRPERWWRLERKLLRRLHRKLATIDDVIAFVGGINIIDDHHHPEGETDRLGPRFDFAVRIEGPLVAAVAITMRRLWWTMALVDPRVEAGPMPHTIMQPRPGGFPGGVAAALLLRDNLRNRRTIEAAYLQAIEDAREEVVLANAYFIPTRRFRTALRKAAKRGVRVRLLLQGRVEYALQHYAQRALYGQLLDDGIEIHEYVTSYLHAKVAVVDRFWATVGSSNIDPYSLLLAREANVVVFDHRFALRLAGELDHAMARDAQPLHAADYARRGVIARGLDWVAYMLVGLATATLARARNY